MLIILFSQITVLLIRLSQQSSLSKCRNIYFYIIKYHSLIQKSEHDGYTTFNFHSPYLFTFKSRMYLLISNSKFSCFLWNMTYTTFIFRTEEEMSLSFSLKQHVPCILSRMWSNIWKHCMCFHLFPVHC